MTAYSINYLRENLDRIAEETIDNSEQTIITLDSGKAFVMLPLEEFESWKETQYLLSSRANRERLLKSIEHSRAGKLTQRELIDP